jgi:Protein of unknown function (DUF3987)
MDACFDLVRHAEEAMAAGFDDERRKYETKKQAARARREAWEIEIKAAIKAGDDPPGLPEDAVALSEPVRRAGRRLHDRKTARPRRRFAPWLAGCPRRASRVARRFRSMRWAWQRSRIEMYGDRSYIVDRARNPEALHIRHLSVGVLGGVQPDKLSGITGGPDDGLASRFLWSWPDALPEFSLSRARADDVDAKGGLTRKLQALRLRDAELIVVYGQFS